MKLDKLDILTLAAVAALIFYLAALAFGSRPEGGGTMSAGRLDPSVKALAERESLREYLGHYPPGEDDLDGLRRYAAEHPGNSSAYLHLGKAYQRKGELGLAATSYRRAVELNRSFCDLHGPLYEGETIRELVVAGLKVYSREKEIRPDDEKVRETIRDLYFLQRSIAGGCD